MFSLPGGRAEGRENKRNAHILKLASGKEKAGVHQVLAKGAERSPILAANAWVTLVQSGHSAWSLEVPTTQPSKGTVLGWRWEQEPSVLARTLLLTPWAFLSLSLASVSHLPPSPWELCEGQYLA